VCAIHSEYDARPVVTFLALERHLHFGSAKLYIAWWQICASGLRRSVLDSTVRENQKPADCKSSTVALLHYRATVVPFAYVADLPSRQGLRSPSSDCLVQPLVHRSTVGSRAFSVAGPQVWNCQPPEVTSAPSLTTFRTRLETFLFTESYFVIRLIRHFCVSTLSTVDLAVF